MWNRDPDRGARWFLRCAAVVATLQAVAHSTLFLQSQPAASSPAWPLVQAMQAQTAPGHTTYWGMYFGYGLLSAVTAFFVASLIWLAALFDQETRKFARRLVALILIAIVVHAAVIARYFFLVPLYFDILVSALLAGGWLGLREKEPR